MKRVVLIDSPVANVANIARALETAGAALTLARDPDAVRNAEKVVLPGVGSFQAAMEWLDASGIGDALREFRGMLLGICVGHQVLFESSEEGLGPRCSGLGVLAGAVTRLATALPVPQIGWNRVAFGDTPLFEGIENETPFYFVNSYVVADAPDEIAAADYGTRFTAAVQRGNVFGVQFHPEKSSRAGLQVLRNFVNFGGRVSSPAPHEGAGEDTRAPKGSVFCESFRRSIFSTGRSCGCVAATLATGLSTAIPMSCWTR